METVRLGIHSVALVVKVSLERVFVHVLKFEKPFHLKERKTLLALLVVIGVIRRRSYSCMSSHTSDIEQSQR